MLTLDYIQDPGHGWISADRAMLARLDLLEHVSPYSYQDKDLVWLEEDCDGPRTWVSTSPEIDWRTGAETVYSLHFVGPESKRKYWLRALRNRFRPKVEPRNRGQMPLEL